MESESANDEKCKENEREKKEWEKYFVFTRSERFVKDWRCTIT